MLEGIDISVWQGRIQWNAVSGIAFAIAKASEGVGFEDPQWPNNQAGLLAPGPIVGGSYHFGRPDFNDPISEADWYLSRHAPQVFQSGTPWIFSLDAESGGGSAGWCYAFMDRVSARVGYDCWFYSYTSWISARNVSAFNRPLWVAAPSSPRGGPPAMGWPAVTAHQWGLRGVSGIGGQVDANDFLGDQAALLKLAGAGASPSPAQEEEVFGKLVQSAVGPVWLLQGNTKRQILHSGAEELGYWLKLCNQTEVDRSIPQYALDRVPAIATVPEDLSGTSLKSYNDPIFPLPKKD